MLIGPVISLQDPIILSTNKSILFDYRDSTNGRGSFASYNELDIQGRDQLTKTDHGSGTIKKEMLFGTNRTIYLDQDSYFVRTSVDVSANSNIEYAPRPMTIGTGYYVAHPLHLNSRLGDKIQIKNYASETSMVQETKDATAINGNLKAETLTIDSYNGNYLDFGGIFIKNSGKVTDGTTHVGMLHSNTHDTHFDKSAWGIADIDIDEVYSGTFSLGTNMSLFWPVTQVIGDEDWLPCSCYEGWDDMNIHDQRYHSAKGFFDYNTCPFPYCKP